MEQQQRIILMDGLFVQQEIVLKNKLETSQSCRMVQDYNRRGKLRNEINPEKIFLMIKCRNADPKCTPHTKLGLIRRVLLEK